jgi:7,8-dihydroneopterin aldolase/epimerase/oxygenase
MLVQLKNLEFFAYHGLYDFEKKLGCKFIVNASLILKPQADYATINNTVDYTQVYQLISKWMAQPHDILEDLLVHMANDIFTSFDKINELTVSIEKATLPLPKFTGSAVITYTKKR